MPQSTNRGLPASGAANDTAFAKRTYNSFSGVDMVVTFGGKICGELQGISFTIQREKAPIYSMGEADPRSYSRAKRGIAGSMVFVVFDRSALLEVMKNTGYIANKYSVPSGFEGPDIVGEITQLRNNTDIQGPNQPGLGFAPDGRAVSVSRIAFDKIVAKPNYLDQVLPFDVVITAANEYGAAARMYIHGVEILNVGSSMSINDITTDEACTYVANAITPWKDQTFIQVAENRDLPRIFT